MTVESEVDSSLLEQLGVGSGLCYCSALYHCNAVGVVDGGETVSDHDARPALPGLVQSLLYYLLALCVQGRGGLVQEEDFGVPHQSTGDGNALLLAPRQLGALAAHVGAVALQEEESVSLLASYRPSSTYLRQGVDEGVDVGSLGSLHHFLVRYFSEVGSVADVLGYVGVKEHRLLGHDADLGAQPADVEVLEVSAVQSQAARQRVIEPLDQRDHGALATATGPHQSQSLARLYGHVQALQDFNPWPRGILKHEVISTHLSYNILLREEKSKS